MTPLTHALDHVLGDAMLRHVLDDGPPWLSDAVVWLDCDPPMAIETDPRVAPYTFFAARARGGTKFVSRRTCLLTQSMAQRYPDTREWIALSEPLAHWADRNMIVERISADVEFATTRLVAVDWHELHSAIAAPVLGILDAARTDRTAMPDALRADVPELPRAFASPGNDPRLSRWAAEFFELGMKRRAFEASRARASPPT